MDDPLVTCAKCRVSNPKLHYHSKKTKGTVIITKWCEECRRKKRLADSKYGQRNRSGQVARLKCTKCLLVKAVKPLPNNIGGQVPEAICLACSACNKPTDKSEKGRNIGKQASQKPSSSTQFTAPVQCALALQDIRKDHMVRNMKGKTIPVLVSPSSDGSDDESESDCVRPVRAVEPNGVTSDSDTESSSSYYSTYSTSGANDSDNDSSFDDPLWRATRSAWEQRNWSPIADDGTAEEDERSKTGVCATFADPDVHQLMGQTFKFPKNTRAASEAVLVAFSHSPLSRETRANLLLSLCTEPIPQIYKDYARLVGSAAKSKLWRAIPKRAHRHMAEVAQSYRDHCRSKHCFSGYFPPTKALLDSYFNSLRSEDQPLPGTFEFNCLRNWHRIYQLDTSSFAAYVEMRFYRGQHEFETAQHPPVTIANDNESQRQC